MTCWCGHGAVDHEERTDGPRACLATVPCWMPDVITGQVEQHMLRCPCAVFELGNDQTAAS